MRRIVWAWALAFAACASCSLLTDLSSLSPPDASKGDAFLDAPPPLDAPPSDAGVSCPGYPLAFLCDDFVDGYAPLWKQTVYGDAMLSLSGAQFVSPSQSLLSQTPDAPLTSTGLYAAALEYDVAGVGMKHVRSSYDLYIDELAIRSAGIGGVYVGTSSVTQNYGVLLYVSAGGNKLVEDGNVDLGDGGSTSYPLATGFALPFQSWTRIVVDVDFANSTVSLAATDPKTPPDASLPYLVPPTPIHPTLAGPNTFVYAGISFQTASAGENSATRIYVDDVVFESL
jgi:hypothetical protein